jgi:hypothetical protein
MARLPQATARVIWYERVEYVIDDDSGSVSARALDDCHGHRERSERF